MWDVWFHGQIVYSSIEHLSNINEMRNLQEQAFCYQKLFWPFTVWINCSSDLKKIPNSWPSASNFNFFSRLLAHFFLTLRQNNFGNKIPLLTRCYFYNKEKAKQMVFCYQNCSDVLREKNIQSIDSDSKRSEEFLVTECFFNLFLEISHIW